MDIIDFGKHQFLKKETACPLHSSAIDRIVARGLKQEIRNEIAIKPFLPMVNFESEIFCPEVDVTRAHLAYGDRAIPKLKRELLSKNSLTAKRALNSLLDIVHDPELAVEAIRLQVIPRYAAMGTTESRFLAKAYYTPGRNAQRDDVTVVVYQLIGVAKSRLVRLLSSDDPFIRQRTLMVLGVLSLQPGGKMAIVNHRTIMSNLSVLMMDSERDVRFSAAKTLLSLATWHFGVEELINDYYVYLTINQLENELDSEIAAALLEALISMLDQSVDAKAQALENKGIELAVFLEHSETKLRALGAEYLAQLGRHPLGREEIFSHRSDILNRLSNLLDDEDEMVQTHAAEALMFVLVERLIKNYCLQKLPIMCSLIHCAQYFRSPGLPVNAMKGLACLAEHPEGRGFLLQHIDVIEGIRIENPEMHHHKSTLLKLIRTVI